jgi:DNA uptake protein ComE-like DNA-binding protein
VAAAKKAPAAAASPAAGPVDLNTATQAQLEALPGVGAATAKKIIAGRPYTSVADLSRAGVSAKTITKVSPLVTVSGAAPAAPPPPAAPAAPAKTRSAAAKAAPASGPVDLNTATEAQLVALPGVGPATAKKIIAGRPYSSAADLARAGVPARTVTQITPLVTVGAAAPVAPAAAPVPRAAAPAAPATAGHVSSSQITAQVPPSPGMVWVNTDTKIFHRAGDPWYGKTKKGQFMTEAAALQAGYREAKKGGKAKAPAQ